MIRRFHTYQKIDQLIFLTLQLIDGATLFSKEEVIKEYVDSKDDENIEELLYKKAVYPNGEQLGFYNTSKYSFNDFYEDTLTEEEWEEYLNGFSSEIKDLFKIILQYSYIPFEKLKDYNIKVLVEKLKNHEINLEKKDDIYDFYLEHIDNLLNYDEEYINYYDLSNYCINVLFEGIEFKEKTSILHIGAENTFIISCLNYIKNINPNCDVELYTINNSEFITFALKFLAIINKAKLIHFIDIDHGPRRNYDYPQIFNQHKNFDFVIQTDLKRANICRLPKSQRDDPSNITGYIAGNYIPDFGVTVSSRSIYVGNHQKIEFYKEWLEKDLLESIILIPYKFRLNDPIFRYFKFALLIVLNNNKSEEKRNKFLLVDANENKEIIPEEYSIEDYRDLINNKNIYGNSYDAFLDFIDSEYSKLFNLQDFSKKEYLYFNDEIYDLKMETQKNYYKTEYVKGDERIIKHLNYKTKKLGELVAGKNSHIENISPNNSLYFLKRDNLVVNDKWAFLNHEIINTGSYSGFELISDRVTLQFLYYYLNSEVGINEYNYFARGHRYPYAEDWISEIRVPIPPKKIQDKIVEAMNERDDFLNDVNLLKSRTNQNFFDYKQNKMVVDEFYGKREYSTETQEISMPDNWIYTYGGLVWPLAITYLIATSGGIEKSEKATNLLKLFEFTTAFNSIVLISGIPEDIYEKNKHKIWKKAYDESNDDGFVNFYKLTFGSWVTFHYKIKKIYKKRFDTEIDKEFYFKLLNNDIIEYYKTLKDHRNKEFHEGFVNPNEAESLIKELNIPKTKVFNYLNECYKNLRLFYITGKNDTSTNEHEVIFLNGPYSMPIYSTIHYKGFLEAEALYLYDEEEKKFSKLNSKLIKFRAIDDDEHDWRLYIFIGFENDSDGNKIARYKCYQRIEDELEVSFDLNDLL